ncbi:MAG: glycosyltransferase [Mailhella sp.]|nr:glycosyltransferase [Mailhella sp.]
MKIFFKNRSSLREGSRQKEYGVLGHVVLRKHYAEGSRSIFFLNARIYERKVEFPSISYTILGCSYKKMLNSRVCRLLKTSATIVFIDHSLGGGANAYFDIEKERLLGEANVLRVRRIPHRCNFHCELYAGSEGHSIDVESYEVLERIFASMNVSKFIVSELVSYDALRMLDILKRVKKGRELLFLCHDYHACCPSFTLMGSAGEYCGADTDMQRCRACFRTLRLAQDDWSNGVLLSGAESVESWRRAFAEFFACVDKVVAFDRSVADIFCRYYPHISHKIEVKPHAVPYLRPVRCGMGKTVVAILGNISSVSKGSSVLQYLDDRCDQWGGLDFILAGECSAPLRNIRVLGKYRREKLPELLEAHGVNCVFIPSMWPETFSYTTAEAMLMGLPLVCFDLGAPARRVRSYDKGLILDRTRLEDICSSISGFMDKLKCGA